MTVSQVDQHPMSWSGGARTVAMMKTSRTLKLLAVVSLVACGVLAEVDGLRSGKQLIPLVTIDVWSYAVTPLFLIAYLDSVHRCSTSASRDLQVKIGFGVEQEMCTDRRTD